MLDWAKAVIVNALPEDVMANRFRFNRKNMESIVVEGERVDIVESTLTVVDDQGQPRASFAESDLNVWWQLQPGSSSSVGEA